MDLLLSASLGGALACHKESKHYDKTDIFPQNIIPQSLLLSSSKGAFIDLTRKSKTRLPG